MEGTANRELLLTLCAQFETLIEPGTWADEHDINLTQIYYQELADLGYPVLDEENKTLKDEYLPEGDEAE